mmetsp:Transcript_56026/g.81943  ORF Transcript_56026/g.81943 Transcript_56026/m.81943 type:complete len:127 (-) Transcript_56026:277-657(-)
MEKEKLASHMDVRVREDDEEVPLLFMDKLPKNFEQNSSLLALASFFSEDDSCQTRREKHRKPKVARKGTPGRKLKSSTGLKDKKDSKRKGLPIQKQISSCCSRQPKPTSTAELQLYLNLWNIDSSA